MEWHLFPCFLPEKKKKKKKNRKKIEMEKINLAINVSIGAAIHFQKKDLFLGVGERGRGSFQKLPFYFIFHPIFSNTF